MHRSSAGWFRVVAAVALVGALRNEGQAQGAVGTGSLRGLVTDSAAKPIARVTVHVNGTPLGAVSDTAGVFTVRAIVPGRYWVAYRRGGFAVDSFTVLIRSGETAEHDIQLRPGVVALAGVVVRASPRMNETREEALAVQQGSTNIVSRLSGDEIRALPNANAAEAAARVPGVSTERDEGEGKFVQIRGTEPRLSNVTIDGVHIPGTESGDRISKLDDVPSDLLGAIEVSKTLRADMDADAIGGSVNLVTKVPDGAPRGYVSGQWGQSSLLSRTQGQGGFTYGGRVGDESRFGFLLGGSYDRNNRGINDIEPGWAVDNSGRSYPVEWDQRDYTYGRVRYGLGGDLDYRLSDQSQVWLKGMWSKFYNYGLRYRFDVASGDDSSQAATKTSGIGTGATFTRESSNRTPQEQLWGFTGGGKTLLGALATTYALNYSGTRQSITDYRTSPFSYSGINGNGADIRYDALRSEHAALQLSQCGRRGGGGQSRQLSAREVLIERRADDGERHRRRGRRGLAAARERHVHHDQVRREAARREQGLPVRAPQAPHRTSHCCSTVSSPRSPIRTSTTPCPRAFRSGRCRTMRR